MNGELTKEIEINQGTRQSCPLSLLLFILSIEILNTLIREDRRTKGLKIKEGEIKLQAYADDLVFILEDPVESLIYLMEDLGKYGRVAGLKINYEKTKLLLKNVKEQEKQELKKFNLQITKQNI